MSDVAGVGQLVRLIMRRERLALPLWILLLGALPAGTASAFAALYPTEAELTRAGTAIGGNPAFVAFLGPVYQPSLGGLTVWRVGAISAAAIGIMNVLTVTRHTRAEEQAGRRELLGSTAVGRHAPLFAALLVVLVVDVVIGLLATAGLVSNGLATSGSFAFGVSIASAGWLFAGVGAVASQMFESSRTVNGVGVATVAVSFLLRVVGDSGSASGLGFLAWVSPVGLVQRVRPFAGERWWIVGLLTVIGVVAIGVAQAISARRDVGAGVFALQSGPSGAARSLSGSLGLAIRLQKGLAVSWTTGFAFFGFLIGSATEGFADLLNDNPLLREIIEMIGGESVITDAFLASMFTVFGMMAAAHGVQAMSWLRTEEVALRVEPLLATATPRRAWLSSHTLIGAIVPAIDLLMVGAAAGLAYGLAIGDVGGQVLGLMRAAMVQLPAVWVLIGVALALFGLIPRSTWFAWVALGASFFLTLLGVSLRLPQILIDLSPFSHLPRVPGSPVSGVPIVWLLSTALGLGVLGFAGFSRRDVS